MNGSIQVRVLARAAQKLGKQALRRRLHVSLHLLEDWLEGRRTPTADAFLKAVDVIVDDLAPQVRLQAEAHAALDDAIRKTEATRGTLQVLRSEGLRIVGQRGFEQPFLDFFSVVNEAGCACGSALRASKRVIVTDVASHPLFAGTAAGGVLEEAGCRAVQSTPLLGANGALIGVLSTHYSRPHEPSPRELETIDAICSKVVSPLERFLQA